jgi:hypothetical protein
VIRQAESGEPFRIPPDMARRITYLDRFHLVASDPSIAEIRRSLLSHCRWRKLVES